MKATLMTLTFILSLQSWGWSLVSNSEDRSCIQKMQDLSLVDSYRRASKLCAVSSKPEFRECLVRRKKDGKTNLNEMVASCQKYNNQDEPKDPCQIAYLESGIMSNTRAIDLCHWNSSPEMISCIINLTQKGTLQTEVSIDACYKGAVAHPKELKEFQNCALDLLTQKKSVTEVIRNCPEVKKPIVEVVIQAPIKSIPSSAPEISTTNAEMNYIILPIE